MRASSRNFRYRNRNGAWLDFAFSGMSIAADGALELASVPVVEPPVLINAEPVPGAVAVSNSGEVFFTGSGLILRRSCTNGVEELPAAAPRAVAFSRRRSASLALYEDRLVIFDLPGFSESETWYGFTDAKGIAVDDGGRVYVADAAGVRRYFLSGHPDQSFVIDTIAPSALAVAGQKLYALHGDAVHVFDFDAYPLATVELELAEAYAVAAEQDAFYVGSATEVAVFQMQPDGTFERTGSASGYAGPATALALSDSTLWVHAGSGVPAALRLRAAHVSLGVLRSDALDASGRTVEWERVRAWVEDPGLAVIQFFVHTADDPASNPAFPHEWTAIPVGTTDFYVGKQARYIRVGALISGDGQSTPRLRQIRTDFDQEGYAEFLPEAYRLADGEDRFLERFLGAFRSLFEDAEDRIDSMSGMLDPDAIAPEDLPWLGGFLGLEIAESMSVDEQRNAIRTAFARYAQRGTAAGLRNTILAETGVHAVIDEPFARMSLWQLPARSPDCTRAGEWVAGIGAGLGLGTVFAGAAPQGAVLGAGAVLDASHLITNEEYGMPLFADLAHRFQVLLYEGEVACPEKRAAVDAIVEREKPAHTAAQVCVIRPAMRVGWQGILGVDTVVGGARAPVRFGDGALVLGGAEAGQIGVSATAGISTRL